MSIGSHDEMKIPMMNLIIDMGEYSPYSLLEKIFSIVSKVEMQAYTEQFFNFICFYTINVLKAIKKRKPEEKIAIEKHTKLNAKKEVKEEPSKELFPEKFVLYDIGIFWNIMTYSKTDLKIEKKLRDKSIKCLLNISEFNEDFANEHLLKSLNSIKENKEGSLLCMQYFIEAYAALTEKNKLNANIITLLKGNELFNLILEQLIQYKLKVNEIVNAKKDLKNVMNTVNISH